MKMKNNGTESAKVDDVCHENRTMILQFHKDGVLA